MRRRHGDGLVALWARLTTGLTLLVFVALGLCVTSQAWAGTVGISDTPVFRATEPVTRGGIVLDDKYTWIADRNDGLWRVDRSTGLNAGDVSGSDGGSWDLWWYDPYGNYPDDPDGGSPAGYYIYEAAADGTVYIFRSDSPTTAVGSVQTSGGVAYGVYATDPAAHTLYVATNGGLKVYDITDPVSPIVKIGGQLVAGTILPTLDFSAVYGMAGHGYVYANSPTDNSTYIIDVAASTVVGKVSYGGSNSVRRSWVCQDEGGHDFLYTVNSFGDLWIVNVDDPRAPRVLSFWDSPANGVSNVPGGGVQVYNGFAFVVTSVGNNHGYLYMLDVRDPSRPTVVDWVHDPMYGFNDVRVDGCQIHIAAYDGWVVYGMEGWQPDGLIRRADTAAWTGEAVYETTPAQQIATQAVAPGETATFQVRIDNDADMPDRIGLSGSVKTGWTTQYLLGGLDVTASILDGTFLTAAMDPGQSFNLTLRVTPDASVTIGESSDTVLTSSSSMCGRAVDAVEAQVTVERPQVLVVKDDGLTSVEPGQEIEYVITFGNVGGVSAGDVTLTDVLPTGMSFVSARPAPTQVLADTPGAGQTTLFWDVGSLPSDGTVRTVTVTALVAAERGESESLSNGVQVDYRDDAGNDFSAAAEDVDAVERPLLVKDVDLHQALEGDTLTYTLWPCSSTADLLENVRVVDPLPDGTTYLAGSANAGGLYGSYVPLAAQPGYDEGPPVLQTAMSSSATFVAPGDTLTVTLNVKSSAAVAGVSPVDFTVEGGAYTLVSGPSPASANVPNGGAGVNFVWTVRLDSAAKYTFSAGAEDAALTTSWPTATSASVLAAAGGPDVVTWNLGTNLLSIPGEDLISGRFPAVFGFRGAVSTEFSKYGLNTSSWTSATQAPNTIAKGGCMTSDGAGTIYAGAGNSKWFGKYDLVTRTWTRLADPSNNFVEGGSVQYLSVGGNGYVYALLGKSNRFRRYNIATNTWSVLATTPANVNRGGALTTDGTYLYALRGNRSTDFWRYNVAANIWTAMAPAPAIVNAGGSITRVGGYLYAFRGNGSRDFWRYDIAANSWTAMASALGNVVDGGSLTTDGTKLFAFQGRSKAFWTYSILANTWSVAAPVNFTGSVGAGGSLVYDPGVTPVGGFITLSVSRSLVASGDVVTVRAVVSSTSSQTNVTVPASPTVSATNGATVSLGPPILVSVDDDITAIGDPVIYEWTGAVTAGALPGSLQFASAAFAGIYAWPVGTSASVLVSPPLTFQATVDVGAQSPVVNTGGLYGVPVAQPEDAQSLPAVTELGGSVGDFVWYDADGDAVHDFGEAGLAGVGVSITPPPSVDLGAGPGQPVTTPTDADGYYLFDALPPGSYTLSVQTGTLPAGMAATYDADGVPDGMYSLTLTAGERVVDADFAFDDTGAIGDLVFADDDGDGAPDPGESGLAGLTIRLFADANGNGVVDVGEALLASALTNASGAYQITGLPAGDYVAVVDDADPALPAGYEPTTDLAVAVALTAGEVFGDADFGFTDLGLIGDRLWQDLDGDGLQDPGEPGLVGVQVRLFGPYGTLYATTGVNGAYAFNGLPSGAYTVVVNLDSVPAGYTLGTDPDGVLDGRHDVSLAVGETVTTTDFGFLGLGTIGDTVWRDVDGDGAQGQTEPGISSVTISLYTDVNGDGRAGPGEPLYATAVTDASGAYSFDLLAPGFFVVDVPASDPALVGMTSTTPTTIAVTLAPSQAFTDADFGFGPFAQLGDFVWHDVNKDGAQDAGEPGIAGIAVTLSDVSGVVATATTDADGAYLFRALPAGDYTVTVANPPGYALTFDPDGTLDGSYTATLAAGDYHLDADFGFRATSSIGDLVWLDTDGDGVKDAGESGIAGVRVYLYADATPNGYLDGGDPFIGATETNTSGAYLFEDLIPGQYLVVIEPQDYPTDGMGGTFGPTTPPSLVVILGPDAAYTAADFGFGPYGAVGDTVYFDANGNGDQDTGTTSEYGIPGAIVYLCTDPDGDGDPADGILLATRTTDAYGHYFFGGLPADGAVDYAVVLDTSSTPPGLAVATPNPYPVADLRYGQYVTSADFGLRGTSSIGDLVWYDADGDGSRDPGEPGLPDVDVQLWEDVNGNGVFEAGIGGDLLVATVQTDAAGAYLFQYVNGGSYFVYAMETDADLPAGVTATTSDPVTVVIAAPDTHVDTADVGFGPYMLLGDWVWDDLDRDGVQDYGEPGLAGVTVSLTPPAGVDLGNGPGVAVTTVTTAGGEYVFRALPAGDFIVDAEEASLPAGYVATAADVPPDDTRDSDAVNGAPVAVTLSYGAYRTVDFGFYYQNAALTLEKSAAPATFAAVDETITYTYALTNTGNVALVAPFAVADDRLAVAAPTILILAPGASTNATATYTTTQDDLDAGGIVNTATATAVFAGVPVTSNADTVTVTAFRDPALTLDKSGTFAAGADGFADPGELISYGFTVTNVGNMTLGNVTVNDPLVSGIAYVSGDTNADGLLQVDEAWDYAATYAVTQADIDAGTVHNVATADSDESGSDDGAADVPLPQSPALALEKTATPLTYATVGEAITYTYTVTNSGNVTLSGPFTVADDKTTVTVTQPADGALSPAETTTATATYAITQADLDLGSLTNVASATGVFAGAPVTSNTDAVTVTAVQGPALALEKSVTSSGPYDSVGDLVTYELVATNAGNVTLTGVAISDPLLGSLFFTPAAPATLAPGETLTATGSYALTQADLDAGSLTNVASATGVFAGAPVLSNPDNVTVSAVQGPAVALTKTVTSSGPYDSVGDLVTYELVATNTGNVTLTAVSISDPLLGSLSFTPAAPPTLAPGETLTATGSYALTQADLDAGQVENTATAEALFGSDPYADSDARTVALMRSPAVALTKTVTSSGPYDSVGDLVTYELVATNAGNVTLTAVSISDPLLGSLSFTPAAPATLAPGETLTSTGSYALTQADLDSGQVENTATAEALFGSDPYADSAAHTEPLSQDPALTLEKTADHATYATIGEAITYTYTLTNAGNVALVAPFAVADDRLTVAAPAILVLAPGASTATTATYAVTQADLDAGSLTNTAGASASFAGAPVLSNPDSVTVSAVQGPAVALTKTVTSSGPYDSVGDLVTYELVATNTGNVTLTGVTISDPLLGALFFTPAAPATLAPGETLTATGSYALTQADLDAGQVENTATAEALFGSDPYADSDAHTVALTQGPAVALTKTVTSSGPYDSVGDLVTYELVATNTGNVTLTGVAITDPLLGALSFTPAAPATLAPGETLTATGSYAITQADLDSGSVTNTATAEALFGTEPYADSASHTEPLMQGASLTLEKRGVYQDTNRDGVQSAGDRIRYSFALTNTGNVTLHDVTVTDPMVTVFGGPTTLDTGERDATTYVAIYTLTQADIDAGVVDNVASADSRESGPATDACSVPLAQSPALTLEKSADPSTYVVAGEAITYTYTLTNTGNVTLSGPFTVADDKTAATVTQPADGALSPGESAQAHATYAITQADLDAGSVTNIASGEASFAGAPVISNTDTVTVRAAQGPALSLEKRAAPLTYASVGEVISYVYTLTNTGNVTLFAPFAVGDDRLTVDASTAPVALAPHARFTLAAFYTVTQADIDAGFITNVASATASVNGGDVTSNSDTATVRAIRVAAIDLVKTGTYEDANGDGLENAGDRVRYSFTVTNGGNVALSDVTVSDPLVTVSGGPLATLAAGAGDSTTFSAVYAVTQADIDAGGFTNAAVAAGTFAGEEYTHEASDVQAFNQVSAIDLVKAGMYEDVNGDGVANAGDRIVYAFTVTNTGTVTLSDVTVSDPMVAISGGPLALLVPGASDGTTFAAVYTLTQADIDAGSFSNTATASGMFDGEESTHADSDVQDLDPAPAIGLEKTGAYEDSDSDGIADAGDRIRYSFAVTNTGNVTLRDVTVRDPCATVSGGPLAALAPGASDGTTFSAVYTLTQADIDTGSFTNIATAAGSFAGERYTAADSDTRTFGQIPALALEKTADPGTYSAAGDEITYTYAVTNTGNVTLAGPFSVTDDKLTVDTAAAPPILVPGGSFTVTAVATITQADFDAGSLTNVASASGATGSTVVVSNTDTVTVVQALPPAVTIDKRLAAGQPHVVPSGGTVVYEVVVTNSGQSTVSAVPVVDTYDPGQLTLLSATPSPTAASAGTMRWDDVTTTLGDLAPGASVTLRLEFRVTAAVAELTNTATAESCTNAEGIVGPGATDAAVIATFDPGDVTLSKTASPSAGTIMLPGDTITYTLTAVNNAVVTFPDTVIGDQLPDSVVHVPGSLTMTRAGTTTPLTDLADTDPGVFDAGVGPQGAVRIDLGDFEPEEHVTVTFSVTVREEEYSRHGVLNVSTLASEDVPIAPDARAYHPVDPLTITKTGRDVNGGRLLAGDQIEWVIVVRNTGLTPTTNVVVTDDVPPETRYVSGSIRGRGADDSRTPHLRWRIGTLAVGEKVTLSFRSTVKGGLRDGTQISNQATVSADQSAPKKSDCPLTADVLGDATLLRTGATIGSG